MAPRVGAQRHFSSSRSIAFADRDVPRLSSFEAKRRERYLREQWRSLLDRNFTEENRARVSAILEKVFKQAGPKSRADLENLVNEAAVENLATSKASYVTAQTPEHPEPAQQPLETRAADKSTQAIPFYKFTTPDTEHELNRKKYAKNREEYRAKAKEFVAKRRGVNVEDLIDPRIAEGYVLFVKGISEYSGFCSKKESEENRFFSMIYKIVRARGLGFLMEDTRAQFMRMVRDKVFEQIYTRVLAETDKGPDEVFAMYEEWLAKGAPLTVKDPRKARHKKAVEETKEYLKNRWD